MGVARLQSAGVALWLSLTLGLFAGCTGEPAPERVDKTWSGPERTEVTQDERADDDEESEESASSSRMRKTPSWLAGVTQRLIPFGEDRKRDMAAYSDRHYGDPEWRLDAPKLIVQHFAVAPDVDSIFNTFAPNNPDPSYGELPNVCTHFAVDNQGGAHQFVSLRVRCRHVVGLNHVAIGIEHVGYSDADILDNPKMLDGSLNLTQQLRCAFDLQIKDVIGHNESLSSPYFEEQDPDFQGQTHSDFSKESMDRYRAQLRTLGPCA